MNSYKLLYTCGDSWTAGDELGDIHKDHQPTIKYYQSWPWHLAQNLDIPMVINEANGGGSNIRIFRKTNKFMLDWIKKGKNPADVLIIVGWTTPERSEIPYKKRIYRVTIQNVISYAANFIGRDLLEKYRQAFYDLYEDDYGIQMQLLYMCNTRVTATQLGFKYYDFMSLGCDPQFFKDQHPLLENLFYVTFQKKIADEKLTTLKFGHPTEEGHKFWADLLKKDLIK